MFTGIIEEVGTVLAVTRGARSCSLKINASLVTQDSTVGDSIATNGVCLTVTALTPSGFTADVMPETLNRTSLGDLTAGSPVNLERAMALGDRFGGHIVSGHIDGTGTIAGIKKDDNAILYTINAPSSILRLIVEKGSITVDGISLTVAGVTGEDFTVSLIPHTASSTALSRKKAGDKVNLENDCIGKYVEKLLFAKDEDRSMTDSKTGGLTLEKLHTYGF
jgi:riboflavin synthase